MSEASARTASRIRVMPILSLVSACLFAVGGGFVLGLFADVAANHEVTLNPLAQYILDHRQWLFMVVLPAIAFSLAGLLTKNSLTGFVLAILSGLSLAAAFAIIIVGAIAPLYQYQPL